MSEDSDGGPLAESRGECSDEAKGDVDADPDAASEDASAGSAGPSGNYKSASDHPGDSTTHQSDASTRVESGTEPMNHVRTDSRGRREVIVPMRLYKTVTVFSTLIAVVSVVFGFLLLDAATLQVGIFRRLTTWMFGIAGLQPATGTLDVLLALAGLGAMAFGAGVYVLGTRFRTQEMGKSQEDSRVESDNG